MTQYPQNPATRIWRKDSTLWLGESADVTALVSRLGWLDVFGWFEGQLQELDAWVKKIVTEQRFERTVVLGMGGSSLAPEVFSKLFTPGSGHPRVEVLDSTSPDMVRRTLDGGVQDTLFIVASKSGTTLETMDLYRFFRQQVETSNDSPCDQFVAITDEGSWLDQHATGEGFEKVFINPSDIGGRYSALSLFGLVPAALHGVDIGAILERANQFSDSTKMDDPASNIALALGIDMADHALKGKDKLIINLPTSLQSVGAWIEQLVAESTGKNGVGILPVCLTEESPGYDGNDAFTIAISDGELKNSHASDAFADRKWTLPQRLDIGAEFFKWEFATAIAAGYLGINPFDEPNVSEAKRSTDLFINQGAQLKTRVLAETEYLSLLKIGDSESGNTVTDSIASLLTPADGGYLSILAYLPCEPEIERVLGQLQQQIMEALDVVSTIGFGPRYLHSTGQLHKGGAPVGAFIQLTCDPACDFNVPGRDYSFGNLLMAQADGDISVLDQKDLPVVRAHLKGDRLAAIQALTDNFSAPLIGM